MYIILVTYVVWDFDLKTCKNNTLITYSFYLYCRNVRKHTLRNINFYDITFCFLFKNFILQKSE